MSYVVILFWQLICSIITILNFVFRYKSFGLSIWLWSRPPMFWSFFPLIDLLLLNTFGFLGNLILQDISFFRWQRSLNLFSMKLKGGNSWHGILWLINVDTWSSQWYIRFPFLISLTFFPYVVIILQSHGFARLNLLRVRNYQFMFLVR